MIEWYSIEEMLEPPNDNDLLLQISIENGCILVVAGWIDGMCNWHFYGFDGHNNKYKILFWAHMPEGPHIKFVQEMK